MEKTLQDKIVLLHEEGLSAGKIAQKVKVKKSIVIETLGSVADDGIGSVIETITEATGVKKIVDKVAEAVGVEDCGCRARAKALNKLFPFKKTNDLMNEDYVYLHKFFKTNAKSVNPKIQSELVKIYNNVFNARRQVTSCSSCVAQMIEELRTIYSSVL